LNTVKNEAIALHAKAIQHLFRGSEDLRFYKKANARWGMSLCESCEESVRQHKSLIREPCKQRKQRLPDQLRGLSLQPVLRKHQGLAGPRERLCRRLLSQCHGVKKLLNKSWPFKPAQAFFTPDIGPLVHREKISVFRIVF
jgi:hypothetical protein